MRHIRIDQTEPLSIHGQLVEQIKYRVEIGSWLPGDRLPTVRELAGGLRINYNTIRAAYQNLEREGYIVAARGRGTFVAPDPPRVPEADRERFLDLVDGALAEARSAGLSDRAFRRVAYARSKASAFTGGGVRILFAECNRPDLNHFARTVARGTGAELETTLLDDLRGRDPSYFARFDLIATTTFHVAELREMVGPERAVSGLMVAPSQTAVVGELSQLAPGTAVGLVCVSKDKARSMERALVGVGLTHLRFWTAGLDRRSEVASVFERADEVYISRLGRSSCDGPWPEGKRVRPYVNDVEPAAVCMLRREIADLREAS